MSSNSQQLLPGAIPSDDGSAGQPPADPLAAYVISWLRFEDPDGTTTPADQVPTVVWTNTDATRAVVSAVDARGGARSLRRPAAGSIAGGIYTLLSTLVGNQWTLELYQKYTAKNYGSGNNRFVSLGFGTAGQFVLNTTTGDELYLEYTGGAAVVAGVSLVLDVWYHVAVVSTGTEVRTYIDHVLVHTRSYSYSYTGNITPIEYSVGRAYSQNGDFWDGFTDEARLTLAARTPAQFLPVAGYTGPGDARARGLTGLRAVTARGVFGGGVTANTPGLSGLRTVARQGDFAGGQKLRGARSFALAGQLQSYPFAELHYNQAAGLPNTVRALLVDSGAPPFSGGLSGRNFTVYFRADGTVRYELAQGAGVIQDGDLPSWLTTQLPPSFVVPAPGGGTASASSSVVSRIFSVSGNDYHGGSGVGSSFYREGQYAGFVTGATPDFPWWSVTVWLETTAPADSPHYIILDVEITAPYPDFPGWPLGQMAADVRAPNRLQYRLEFLIDTY